MALILLFTRMVYFRGQIMLRPHRAALHAGRPIPLSPVCPHGYLDIPHENSCVI